MKKTKLGLIFGITTTIATLTGVNSAQALTWAFNTPVSNPTTSITGSFTIDDENLGSGAMVTSSNIQIGVVTYTENTVLGLSGTAGLGVDGISWLIASNVDGCIAPCSLNLNFNGFLTTVGTPVTIASSTEFDQSATDGLASNANTTYGAKVIPFEFNEGLVGLLGFGIMVLGHGGRNRK